MPPPPSTARRHEVTLPGFIFFAITVLMMVFAIHTDTNTLYFAFGLMFGILIVSGILSAISLRNVTVKRLLPDHVIAGEPAEIQYLITNNKRRWPCFAIHITELANQTA
ncbi:MAG: hypothetical protein FWD53_02760, partial [Phycisphaerales bacterium]|nr:hypothetical protein [Phycisphaerales bacterium]